MRRVLAAVALGVVACAAGSKTPPAPIERVTDSASYLSPAMRDRLNLELQEYEHRTRHQVWVWITDKPLPKGVTIEAFSSNAFNSWGVGRRGHDDGAALFVFPRGDRLRMRIQVGFGLERALPDRECVRILRAHGPSMEAGQHDEGTIEIVNEILAAIDAEKAPSAP